MTLPLPLSGFKNTALAANPRPHTTRAIARPTQASEQAAPLEINDIRLRRGRPEWSLEWQNAKTGGVSTHRRHCVRSGLMRAALEANFEAAKINNDLDDFFQVAQDILKIDHFRVRSPKDADLLLDRLYHRLHNQHMNIFYGRGSHNQMLGTLAHGLERFQADFFAALDAVETTHSTEQQTAIRDLVKHWLVETYAYALCEYMQYSDEQKLELKSLVQNHLDVNQFEFDQQAFLQAFNSLDPLNHSPAVTSLMEFKMQQERAEQLCDVLVFECQRLAQAFGDAGDEIDPTLVEAVEALALELLDAANLDLSQAEHDDIRKLQNQQAIAATVAFGQLVDQPNLQGFKTASMDFLDGEAKAAEILDFEADYPSWFEKDESREQLFRSISAPESMMVPSLESSKYRPRQWDKPIAAAFKAGQSLQRRHMIPSSFLRQIGYGISNYAVARDQIPELKSCYERLFQLDQGAIQSLDDLQFYHQSLIHKAHNNPANLYIGDRAEQMVNENIHFAIANARQYLPLINNENDNEIEKTRLYQSTERWLLEVLKNAIGGYLQFTPLEQKQTEIIMNSFVDALPTRMDDTSLYSETLNQLQEVLGVFQKDELPKALRRYDGHQVHAFQKKIQLVLNRCGQKLEAIHSAYQAAESAQDFVNAFDQIKNTMQAETFQPGAVAHSSTAAQAQSKKALKKGFEQKQQQLVGQMESLLQGFINLQDELSKHQPSDQVLQEYERLMDQLLQTEKVANNLGLKNWAKARGSQTN